MGTDQELAILFADVVGSTHLYEVLGDDAARETVAHCVDTMKECTEANNGTVIKTMGDEVMSTFETVDEAIQSACQMQQRLSSGEIRAGDKQLAIRIGCHYGQVVVEDRDIFGSAVHTANRMTSQAKSGQIVTTASTIERLPDTWHNQVRQIDLATVRGQSNAVAMFEVLWQPEDATSMLPHIDYREKQQRTARLVLKFQGQEVHVDDSHKLVTLGRAEDNDVTIKGNLISRIHARIEMSRKRFILVDESTNGTFIQRDDGEEHYLRRDSATLRGTGIIGMGRVAARGTPLAIEYTVEE